MANKDEDLVEIQVDSELLDQVKALIAPLGLSPEELVVRFMEYCANPETQGEAKAGSQRRCCTASRTYRPSCPSRAACVRPCCGRRCPL